MDATRRDARCPRCTKSTTAGDAVTLAVPPPTSKVSNAGSPTGMVSVIVPRELRTKPPCSDSHSILYNCFPALILANSNTERAAKYSIWKLGRITKPILCITDSLVGQNEAPRFPRAEPGRNVVVVLRDLRRTMSLAH